MKKILSQTLIVIGAMTLGLMLFSVVPAHAAMIGPGDVPANVTEATGGTGNIRVLVLNIVNFFLFFLGLVATLMVIYGGILYVTSAGAEDKVGTAKKIIMYAIVGIIIILLSFALINTVISGAGTGTEVTAGQ